MQTRLVTFDSVLYKIVIIVTEYKKWYNGYLKNVNSFAQIHEQIRP